jgi:hypothetical protein
MDTGIEMTKITPTPRELSEDEKEEVNRRLEMWNQYKKNFSFLGPTSRTNGGQGFKYELFSEEEHEFLDDVARKKIEAVVRGQGYVAPCFFYDNDKEPPRYLLQRPVHSEDYSDFKLKVREIFMPSQPNGGKRRRTRRTSKRSKRSIVSKKAKKRTKMRR